MLFPAAQATILDTWSVIGLRATGSDSFTVSDLFVPREHSAAGRPGGAPPRRPPLLLPDDQPLRLGIRGVALGNARSMLDAFVRLARAKTPRGLSHPLRESAVVQSELARTEARVGAARALLLTSLDESGGASSRPASSSSLSACGSGWPRPTRSPRRRRPSTGPTTRGRRRSSTASPSSGASGTRTRSPSRCRDVRPLRDGGRSSAAPPDTARSSSPPRRPAAECAPRGPRRAALPGSLAPSGPQRHPPSASDRDPSGRGPWRTGDGAKPRPGRTGTRSPRRAREDRP